MFVEPLWKTGFLTPLSLEILAQPEAKMSALTVKNLEARLPKWADAYTVTAYSSLVLTLFLLYHFFSDKVRPCGVRAR